MGRMTEYLIGMPLYNDITNLYIGLSENAKIEHGSEYKIKKPIVYYGSSITQGGCASRPMNAYQGYISEYFDADYINLGFSGNAKGEQDMFDYIASLDMSAFVMDYDHNSPTAQTLMETHEKMFKTIREAHPDLPIIMMSRPKFKLTDQEEQRLEIIKTTYNNAVASGDKNVYLITGKELTALCQNEGTVDNCHPTDFGFASMAKAVGDVIEKIKL
jgi:lysophospholipase L1-like esterase